MASAWGPPNNRKQEFADDPGGRISSFGRPFYDATLDEQALTRPKAAPGIYAFNAPLVMPFMNMRVDNVKRMPRGIAEIT